ESFQQVNAHELPVELERSHAGRPGAAKGVENYITSAAACPDTEFRERQRHHRRMRPTEFFNRYVPHVAFVLAFMFLQSAEFCPAHPMLSAQVPLFLVEQRGLGPS